MEVIFLFFFPKSEILSPPSCDAFNSFLLAGKKDLQSIPAPPTLLFPLLCVQDSFRNNAPTSPDCSDWRTGNHSFLMNH